MTSCRLVELSNHFPLVQLEYFLLHQSVGVLEPVQDKLVCHVLIVVVGMIHPARILAGIDTDKHRVTSLDRIAESGKERRCLVSLEVS